MDRNTNHLPSDLRARIARCFVDNREFTNDEGQNIKYKRLVVQFTIGDDVLEFLAPVKKNDELLLKLTDDYSRSAFNSQADSNM